MQKTDVVGSGDTKYSPAPGGSHCDGRQEAGSLLASTTHTPDAAWQ